VDGMLDEGRHFATLAPNIVVKVAMSENGLEAISRFADEGIKTNCTLIFTANQGLLAAKAGASLISPFVGRLDDIGRNGMALVEDCVNMVDDFGFRSEIIAASIRGVPHVIESIRVGAHIATVPYATLMSLFGHPLTDKGIDAFMKDWNKAGLGSIL